MKKNLVRFVVTAVLAAVVLILQWFVGGVTFGGFTVTFTLVPIILGAVLYGPGVGAILGCVFSLAVVGQIVTGAIDLGSLTMFAQNPFATVAIVLVKGTAAGAVAGFISKALSQKNLKLSVVLSAIAAPLTNTGIFLLGFCTVFSNLLTDWTAANGFANAFVFIFAGLVGLNFVIELALDLLLVPAILTVIKAVTKK